MNDPNDIFKQENTHSVLYGFVLPTSLSAFYTTRGAILDNDGNIQPTIANYSTVRVSGYKSSIPVRPGRDPEYNLVFTAERKRSTDFVAVDVDEYSDQPDWDYTPIYDGFRDIPGTEFMQFTQRVVHVKAPGSEDTWVVEAHPGFFRIIDPANTLTDIGFSQAQEVPHLHMAFDVNARPVVTWEHNGLLYVYQYDTEFGDFFVAQVAEGITPFVGQYSADLLDNEQEQYLIYSRQGGLRYRISSEEYETEYTIYQFGIGSVLNVGLTQLNALVISYLDASTGRVRHLATNSNGFYQSETLGIPSVSVSQFSLFTAGQITQGHGEQALTKPAFAVDSFSLSFQAQ